MTIDVQPQTLAGCQGERRENSGKEPPQGNERSSSVQGRIN
jgi:hypothetical protein